MRYFGMIALTAEQQVERWDRGDTCWTLEMGGLGPGYEQCLQIAAMEATRWLVTHRPRRASIYWLGEHRDRDQQLGAFEALFGELDAPLWSLGLGLSGAQVGAAKRLAVEFWMFGPRAFLERCTIFGKGDRLIQVARYWPQLDALNRAAI